jgi:hypothetical protein
LSGIVIAWHCTIWEIEEGVVNGLNGYAADFTEANDSAQSASRSAQPVEVLAWAEHVLHDIGDARGIIIQNRKEQMMKPKRRSPRHAIAPHSQDSAPPETNPRLAAAVLEIVDKQLRDATPPETRQTFERLVAAGYMPESARQLLAHVVVSEIFTVMARGEHYDEARFIAALHRLPALPDEA